VSARSDYLDWLVQQHRYSDNTFKAVGRDLQWLCAALGAGDGVEPDWSAVSADAVRTALSRARAQGLAAATLARLASSCRGFFRYLGEQGIVAADLMQGIRTPRKPKRLPKALSPDEAAQLLSADSSADIAPSSSTSQTDHQGNLRQALVLAELLYGSGLRVSEALGLDRSEQAWRSRSRGLRLMGGWLDMASGELHIVGKGAKPRVVPLGEMALKALKDWIEHPVDWPAGESERPVFINQRGRRLAVRSAQRLMVLLASQSGLQRHLHPHMLRHSFASHVLQSSGDLRAVQELMGHASIASTQVYTSLDFQHLSAVYDKAHPRAKAKRSSA